MVVNDSTTTDVPAGSLPLGHESSGVADNVLLQGSNCDTMLGTPASDRYRWMSMDGA